jgi:hypothetical protein
MSPNSSAEDAAKIRVGFPWWLRPFLMRGVAGITIGRRVYLATHDDALLRHELAHVRQLIAAGFFRFYWRYLVEYVHNRRAGMSSHDAYCSISYEREAVAAERSDVDI